ncbi:MAG: amino acid adenylation domain-containing protein, partial [Bacteroidota bacterium]
MPVVETKPNYGLSSSQKRMWILSQYQNVSGVYNISGYYSLDQSCNLDHFRTAIDQVIDRHEILRTVFKEDEKGAVKQWILSREDIGFELQEITELEVLKEFDHLKEFLHSEAQKPFDLSTGPLLRVTMIHLEDGSFGFHYCMHHIICDGWSMNVLVNDTLTFYQALERKETANLPELRIQFKDFSAWQTAQLKSAEYEKSKDYWLDKLSDEIPLIDLPTYKLRPKLMTFNGRRLTTALSEELSTALKEFCKQHGGSLFMGILTAWKSLLYRYTGQTDIVVGTSSVEREDKELEHQIGFYVNTMAIRNSIDPDLSFESHFKAIRASVIDDYAHQKYPFDKLLEELNFSRDTSRSALFDVFVTMRTTEKSDQHLNDESQFGILDHGKTVSKFDLDLGITELGNCIALDMTFNEDVYESETVVALMQHFKQLLSALLKHPDLPIDKVDFLSSEENDQLLHTFNDTDVDFATDRSVIDMFEEQVKQTPDQLAVACNGKELSYRELDEISNQVANILIHTHNVSRGDVVAIQLERSEWAVVALLGILKAGAAYLPIDPDLPDSRKEHMATDAQIGVMITQVDYMFDSDFFQGALFVIDVEIDDSASKEPVATNANPEDLAYIIYTSGSTGLPKGVCVEHHSLLNSTLARGAYYSSLDSFLLVPSFSFDSSIAIIWNTLTTGAALHVVSNETLKDPQQVIGILTDYQVQGMLCVPSFYKFLMNESEFEQTSLKVAILAGEYLPENLVIRHYELFANCELYNEYGPTENTVWASVAKIDAEFDRVTIGRPINNCQIHILNNQMNLMPIGVVGELYIGGKNLAAGYLNRPELTEERFVAHPFETGEKLYKTGDLGRWLPDGNIEFMGRVDDQVKIRGFRIELGEIEQQLQAKDYINNSVVLARDSEDGSKELVAFVVSDEPLKLKKIREDLGAVLPDYMIPARFVQLDKIPLTKNGKINKKALQQSDADELASGADFKAASTPEEKVLVGVLQDVLKRENISVKDSFYNLGGDSIKSILVISRLKQNGYALKIDDILRYPVIDELATRMVVNVHQVDQSEVSGAVALTPIQHYFFGNEYVENKSHYNQSVLLVSTERIDSTVLEQCIESLVAHHDALRMVFRKNKEGYEQVNLDASQSRYTVDFYDLLESEDPFQEMHKIGQGLQSSFDLDNGSLFKVAQFRLPDGDRLALISHHLIIDGVSWRILLEDLATLYEQIKSGFPVNLPAKTDSFQRWASLQQEYVNDPAHLKERDYWEQILQQPSYGIPFLQKIDKKTLGAQEEFSFQLDRTTTNLLQTKFHNVYSTSINDFLLAGLALAMKEVYGLDRCVLEMEGHGREELFERLDISRTVGWFTSLYPLVLDMNGVSTNRDALIHVKENLRNVPNKGVGYGMWRFLTNSFEHPVKPTVSFNYLGDFGESAGNADISIFNFSSESIGANLDVLNEKSPMLHVSGMMLYEQLRMSIRFPTAYYDTGSIKELLASYERHLQTLIEDICADEANYVTPSDLTFPNLSMEELSKITSQGAIEDVYRLSPLQRGIYYDWMAAGSSSLYFEQTSYRLTTKMDLETVEKAVHKLFAKYGALRTTF